MFGTEKPFLIYTNKIWNKIIDLVEFSFLTFKYFYLNVKYQVSKIFQKNQIFCTKFKIKIHIQIDSRLLNVHKTWYFLNSPTSRKIIQTLHFCQNEPITPSFNISQCLLLVFPYFLVRKSLILRGKYINRVNIDSLCT